LKSEEGRVAGGEGIQAGIISFKDLSAGVKALKLDTGDLKTDLLDENSFVLFENALHILLTDVFSPQAAFTQTDDLKICGYCSFAGICRR
jgi:hypothetical protein